MTVLVSLSGVAVAAIGLVGVVTPHWLVTLLADRRILTSLPVTVGLRVGFGILFLIAAPHCRLPEVVWAVGCLELAGAFVLLLLGKHRLHQFVAWWLRQSAPFVRRWCWAATAFGVLLAYAGV